MSYQLYIVNASRRLSAMLGVIATLSACGRQPPPPPPPEVPALSTDELFQAPARVVWCRQVIGGGNDPFAKGNNFILMGHDTLSKHGTRVLADKVGNYRKPLFTPDGAHVVYTDLPALEIRAIEWASGEVRILRKGMSIEVWRDPEGVTWVYYAPTYADNLTLDGSALRRFRFEAPDDSDENVWNQTPVTPDNFQLSADGKVAAGLFPWSIGGLLRLDDMRFQRMGTGCWTSMSPDNSYKMWIFDGAHRNVMLYDWQAADPVKISVNSAPGCGAYEVYHPRWSNHPRIMAISGPYRGGKNAIQAGGSAIHIFVGRFDESFTRIEAWSQLSGGDHADFFPDVWVAGGEQQGQSAAPNAVAQPTRVIEDDQLADSLQFRWIDQRGTDVYHPSTKTTRLCGVEPFGRAVAGRFREMDVRRDGWRSTSPASEFLTPVRAAGAFTLLFTVRPLETQIAGAGFIMGSASSLDAGNFLVAQYRGDLVLRMRTSEREFASKHDMILGSIAPNVPQQVVVCFADGTVRSWINGRSAARFTGVAGTLDSWEDIPLYFGAVPEGANPWAGYLEGVQLFSGALSEAQISRLFDQEKARWHGRATPPRTHVEAELVSSALVSSPQSILPYRRLLSQQKYRVLNTHSGPPPLENEIVVLEWAVLDGQKLDLPTKPGARRTLLLEPSTAHPQLQGERVDELDDIVLDLFFSVE